MDRTINRWNNTTVVAFTIVDCCQCAMPFGIPNQLYHRAAGQCEGSIWCPGCGTKQGWHGDSEEVKARKRAERRLASARARATHLEDQYKSERRSHAATKGQLTKTKKRVAAGVCPCCNRTFKDLARHMAGQHPDYTP